MTESPAADALVELVQDEAYLADRWQREAVTIAAASQHLHFLQAHRRSRRGTECQPAAE
ncbi:MAG: hypothetical protein R3C12_15380 [Planctomycetaceae bacterium]